MVRALVARFPLAWLVALAAIGQAAAEADGPDFYRVVGVAPHSALNMRAAPSTDARRIGAIPAGTDGLRNLGCKGGLSFAEWQKADEAAREAGRRARWCRIAFGGTEGWVAGRYLAEGGPPKPQGSR
jgi:uncharacterized protein YraI